METCEELIPKTLGFLVPFLPQYKEKDEHFTQFIIKHFPEFLEKMENKMNKNGTKYLCANNITLADIILGAFFLKLPYNDSYPNQHILQAIMENYPKTKALAENLRAEFDDFAKSTLKVGF